MNAIVVPTKSNPSTRRIQILSQILKGLVLIYMVVIPLVSIVAVAGVNFVTEKYVLLPGQTMGPMPGQSGPPAISTSLKLFTSLSGVIYLLGAVVFYRLLNLYEKGIVFSAANVRLFRLLGWLAVCKGLIAAAALAASYGDYDRIFTMAVFAALRSPWVIGGFFGIMLSHIMDEGRKIQEEQDLTV